MATTDRTGAPDGADALAGRLREASFVHLLVRADGGPLAAACLLAGACASTGTSYQVSVVGTRSELYRRREAVDGDGTALTVGIPGENTPDTEPVTALEAAEALGADPDPALALAGVVADGGYPEDAAPSILDGSDLERRAGLASPVADPADGLAHSTLAHAPYSGDPEAAEAAVAELPTDDRDRRLASMLAIDVAAAEGATDRAAEAVERAVRPLAGGPLETVEGYADVLEALATAGPGLAVETVLREPSGDALDAWREHAQVAHGAVRSADPDRHAGLVVVETDGPVRTVARLVRDFRSPEPAVLAVGEAEAALATVDAPADPIEAAAEAADGSGLAGSNRGYARFEPGRADDLVEAVREAI